MAEIKKSLLFILSIVLFVFAISFIGNIITIADKIAVWTNLFWMEYVFYGLIATLIIWFIVVPFCKVVKMPVLSINGKPIKQEQLNAIARNLADTYQTANGEDKYFRSKVTRFISQKNDQVALVTAEIKRRLDNIDKTIKNYSLNVFLLTAISQSSRLDAVSVLVMNFRMIYNIICSTGYRPNKIQLIKLYWYVMSTGLLAYVSSEVLDEAMFTDVGAELGAKVGSDFISKFAGKVMGSVADGSVNALMTLRLGYITKHYLEGGFEQYRNKSRRIEIYKSSIKEAFKASTDIPKLAFGKLGKNFF